MSDQHVNDLLDLYALGALEPAEMLEVERHLEVCVTCRATLEESTFVVEQLAWAAEQQMPPPELQIKVRRRIESLQRAGRIEEPRPARRSWRDRFFGRGPRPLQGLALAGLFMIVLLAGWNLRLQRSLDELTTQVSAQRQAQTALLGSDARVITMSPQPAAPEARGNLVLNPSGKDAYLVASGLPRLPGDKAYQFWLAEGDARTSAAVFRPDKQGSASFFVHAPKPLSSYTGCGITIEPASGSPSPTGDRVLRAAGWNYKGGN
jgi:anti-sigma-K factor RskA